MEILFIVIIISVLLVLISSISWANYKGSPWVPTSFKMVHKMLDLADVKPNELVYDLGCGDGRIAVVAARKYQASVVGIESFALALVPDCDNYPGFKKPGKSDPW